MKATQSKKSAKGPKPGRGRGRPRANGSVSTSPREDILRAATRLLSSKGIDGTRIADIADGVGVRSPSIYYHFRDMEEILRELMNFAVFDASSYVDQLGSKTSPTQCLHNLIRDQLARLNKSGMDVWFVTETAQLHRYKFPEVARKVRDWREAVGTIYAAGRRKKEFVKMEPEVAVAAVAGITYGAYRHAHGGGKMDPDDMADICVRALGGTPP